MLRLAVRAAECCGQSHVRGAGMACVTEEYGAIAGEADCTALCAWNWMFLGKWSHALTSLWATEATPERQRRLLHKIPLEKRGLMSRAGMPLQQHSSSTVNVQKLPLEPFQL